MTLHVGLGTFQPLHAEQVEEARLHTEHYRITAENAAKIGRAAPGGGGDHQRADDGERAARRDGREGETAISSFPGFAFRGRERC